jgi:transposase InsO family protein
MDNNARITPRPSSVALQRYAVLAQVEALILDGWPASAAVREVARRPQLEATGDCGHVAARTVQRWRAAYTRGGLPALERQARPHVEASQVLPEDLVDFLRTEKAADPRASVPELIRRARERRLLPADLPVDRVTVWRACTRLGLPTRAQPCRGEGDTRRWIYPHRMQCVLADGKHFRAGATRARRVALTFLDDATRFALTGLVGTAEDTTLFLGGLHTLVRHHGLPDRLYLDHGPGFIADDTVAVVAALGAWLIHGQAHYPAGHGAIERFQRTLKAQLLRGLDTAAEVDPDCQALTLRLQHFLHRYNDTPHETLAGQTPRQRWQQGRPLRFPDHQDDLDQRFVLRLTRKVSADHVLQLDGQLWEVPRGLAHQWVEVHRHALTGRRWLLHQGRRVELARLDPVANATDRRHRTDPLPQPDEGVPTTAAQSAFQQDLRPLVDDQGGYRHPDDEDHPCPTT